MKLNSVIFILAKFTITGTFLTLNQRTQIFECNAMFFFNFYIIIIHYHQNPKTISLFWIGPYIFWCLQSLRIQKYIWKDFKIQIARRVCKIFSKNIIWIHFKSAVQICSIQFVNIFNANVNYLNKIIIKRNSISNFAE